MRKRDRKIRRNEVIPVIELKHVSKTYDSGSGGGVDALKDVSLTIADGDIYGIIGMSGAGKSTLVRCMSRLKRWKIMVMFRRAARSWAGVMVSSR